MLPEVSTSIPDQANQVNLTHKVFEPQVKSSYSGLFGIEIPQRQTVAEIRLDVEQFVNESVGVENCFPISELINPNFVHSVIFWYRKNDQSHPKKPEIHHPD